MNLHLLPQPVEQAYGGGDSLSMRKLQDLSIVSNANFKAVQDELLAINTRYRETRILNKQLCQLLNWIATTNPQILDEFQTTATAFDKLIPRDTGDSDVACAQA